MIFVNDPGDWGHVLPPFDHAAWHGWTPTDLIFPFFLFIVGTAGVFSMARREAGGATRAQLARHAVTRGFTIVLVGWLLAAWPFNPARLLHLRIPGVLPRIGVVYALGTLLLLAFGKRRPLGAAAVAAALLALHTAILFLPGYDLTKEGNVQVAVDLALLKGHLWKPAWDPEGIVSTLSAIATMLTGALAGFLLVSKRTTARKAILLAAWGAAGAAAGLLWQAAGLPVNKGLWTGSYVLLTSGLASLSVALSLLLVDVAGWRRPFRAFVTFGTNPLLAFVLSGFLAKNLGLVKWTAADGKVVSLHAFLYRTLLSWIGDPYLRSHAWAVAFVAVCWAVLRLCETRGWYWKV